MQRGVPVCLFALAAALMFSAPVQAAENLDCTLSLRSESEDAIAFAAFEAGKLGSSWLEQHAPQIKACQDANKWSDQATFNASRILYFESLQGGMRKEMAVRQLPVERLTQLLADLAAELGVEKMREIGRGQLTPEVMALIRPKFEAAQVLTEAQLTRENGRLIGGYFSAYCGAQISRKDFAVQ